MSEYINKQTALHLLCEMCEKEIKGSLHYPCKQYKRFEQLLSAEIIFCEECKHAERDDMFHDMWCRGRKVKPGHYCGYAERREKDDSE